MRKVQNQNTCSKRKSLITAFACHEMLSAKEYLWTTDVCNFFIVHGIGNYGERLWNLWHFRNYKDDDVSFGEKVKRILVRIVIYTIIVLIVLQLLYVLVTMMVK